VKPLPKLSTIFCAGALLASSAFADEIRPVDASTPLFRIFQALPSKAAPGNTKGPQVTMDDKRPLLVVWSVRDVRLAPDRKGVLLRLIEKDRKIFAALTNKYNQGLLLLEAQGGVLEAIYITEPVENGVLEFRYPDDATVAQYLRRRFKLAEFR
jgi:hypothetical protein